ncbi:uncharacterized protein LOC124142015 [Haliotis rufescens]|uniref:uncharacterized protein LOC124142015 n=1 Tax=Haliotis rufescens TaxID=6454 RepID=UPI00201F7BF7|nr:uncharacterized protein LOC124142015 [Haliotis rufescens]
MDVFACGFNGFQQISQLQELDVQKKSTQVNVPPYFDSPVKLNVTTDSLSSSRCLITWSKLRFLRNKESGDTEELRGPVAGSWDRTVYRTATGQYHIGDGDGDAVPHPTVRVDVGPRVDHVVGGEDRLYCIHDGGRLSEIVEGGAISRGTTEGHDPRKCSDGKVAFMRQVFEACPVTSLSCGKEHVLFLTENGHVFSFGLGSRGQLGHDTVEEEKEPRMVDCLDGLCVVGVAAGGWHSAAVTASGDLFTWGWNESGQLGHSTGHLCGTDVTAIHDEGMEGTARDSPNLAEISPIKATDPESIQVKGADQEGGQTQGTVRVTQIHGGLPVNADEQCSNPTQNPSVCSDPLNTETAGTDASREPAEPLNTIITSVAGQEAGRGDGAGHDKVIDEEYPKVIDEECGKVRGEEHGKFVDEELGKFVDEARVLLISSPLLVTSLPDDYTAVKVSCGSRHTAVVTGRIQSRRATSNMFPRNISCSLKHLKRIRSEVITARKCTTRRKGYVPYGKTGSGNYGSTFTPQTVEFMKPVRDKLLSLVTEIPFKEQVFNIGDYGTGDGATSMTLLKELLVVLKERHGSERQFQVIYEDQDLNDFNSLFKRLSGAIPDPPSYLLNMNNVFALTSGVHFYKQCVPSDSMHCIMCMIAAHWLSKTPTLYKESLYIYPDSSAEEKTALRDQSISDWETFLLMRSRELKKGGVLAVSLSCEYVDETSRQISFTLQNFVFLMTDVWRNYRNTGKITDKEFINTNIAYCHYNMNDLKEPFENNTSAVWKSGLRLVSTEVIINNNVFYSAWKQRKDLEGVDDRDGFARAYVAAHRNWSNSTFIDGLSDARTREERLNIVDDFYGDIQGRIANMNPDVFKDESCLNYLVIVKE